MPIISKSNTVSLTSGSANVSSDNNLKIFGAATTTQYRQPHRTVNSDQFENNQFEKIELSGVKEINPSESTPKFIKNYSEQKDPKLVPSDSKIKQENPEFKPENTIWYVPSDSDIGSVIFTKGEIGLDDAIIKFQDSSKMTEAKMTEAKMTKDQETKEIKLSVSGYLMHKYILKNADENFKHRQQEYDKARRMNTTYIECLSLKVDKANANKHTAEKRVADSLKNLKEKFTNLKMRMGDLAEHIKNYEKQVEMASQDCEVAYSEFHKEDVRIANIAKERGVDKNLVFYLWKSIKNKKNHSIGLQTDVKEFPNHTLQRRKTL